MLNLIFNWLIGYWLTNWLFARPFTPRNLPKSIRMIYDISPLRCTRRSRFERRILVPHPERLGLERTAGGIAGEDLTLEGQRLSICIPQTLYHGLFFGDGSLYDFSIVNASVSVVNRQAKFSAFVADRIAADTKLLFHRSIGDALRMEISQIVVKIIV